MMFFVVLYPKNKHSNKMKFSYRTKQITKELQLESMDEDLRNCLWNIYYSYMLTSHTYKYGSNLDMLSRHLWKNYFRKPVDEMPVQFPIIQTLKTHFFKCKWYEVYDLIEITMEVFGHYYTSPTPDKLYKEFNEILESEFSGYRFIEGILAPITNSIELQGIEDALTETSGFTMLKGCNIHLNSALLKLSDRQNPDYRNSIKESISAVESLAKVISGNVKDTLGEALNKIKKKVDIHPALELGFKQIYGYTSDSDGIRHALMGADTCDFEDAQFMLVSCSAFINYLIAKANKAGISLS